MTIFVDDKDYNCQYSIDIVIVKYENDEAYVIKRNLNKNSNDINAYSWAEIPTRYEYAYEKISDLNEEQKQELSRIIIESKKQEKRKPANPPLSGFELFLRAVNNYGAKKN
ncbi:MAG: hypothetical protein PHY83_00115 [Bacilli bacterium]|nr:hypothetical protein [Bacilli bacterium]MDD3098976.1 hypothetical protein [Bacilli bacterium]